MNKEDTPNPAYKRIFDADLKGVRYPNALRMKCLLCSKIINNPQSYQCKAYPSKPDSILYDNADCPSFERSSDAEGLRWIEGYVKLSGKAYVPRQDDTPPEGWEEINKEHAK